jgi:acetyltransferase-like isoleucine patch superfamily enzyme
MESVLKRGLKAIFRMASLSVAFLPAAACLFGRLEAVFVFFAQAFAACPGIPGDYLRVAYYRLTLATCSASSRISFGTFFAHPEAKIGARVYLGSYCVMGKVIIGDGCQIASGVQILSGSRQHARQEDGSLSGAERGVFQAVEIGAGCWIGAGAIVMADVGTGATVGAGSVVTRPVPDGTVVAGNPAKPLPAKAGQSDGA